MRHQTILRATRYIISTAAVLFVLPALVSPLCAQSRAELSERDRNLMGREMQLREMEKPITMLPRFEQKMLLKQINKDFERIQLVNREIMRNVATENAHDIKKILKATSEMKTVAARLKMNLLLPESERRQTEAQTVYESAEIKSAILNLNKTVKSFVDNPVFQSSSRVIDAQLSLQARRDLESIIELCRNIKKSAEKLERNLR